MRTSSNTVHGGFEHGIIVETLEECGGNVRKAARRLGLSRTGLYKRMRAVGIPLPPSEDDQADDGGQD